MKFVLTLISLAASIAAFAQQSALQLSIVAEGASDETAITVQIITNPGTDDGTVVTVLGSESFFEIPVPDGTMQGTVMALAVDCLGDSIFAEAPMIAEDSTALGATILTAEIELDYCDDEEEEEEEIEWDELNVDALAAYLDSMCYDPNNIDNWVYCGLIESLNSCLEGDSTACDELGAWLETVEWLWQDSEEEEEEEEIECDASFVMIQAFDSDSNEVANELFVYVIGFDEDNDFFWDFGDEGTSTDPLPTWEYETDGPYVLCLTVSNEDGDCSDTFCFTLSVDSLGWFDGIQGGFSITALPGSPDVTSRLEEITHSTMALPVVQPNPSVHGQLGLVWNAGQAGALVIEVMDLTGQIVHREQQPVTSVGEQRLNMDIHTKPGLHLVRLTQGNQHRTVKWLAN